MLDILAEIWNADVQEHKTLPKTLLFLMYDRRKRSAGGF